MRRLLVIAFCLGLAGCGFGPGMASEGDPAQLSVTRDFGRQTVASAVLAKVHPSDTVMRFLQNHTKTTTRYGGGFVQSIDGISGSGSSGQRDWFYFVNGVEAPTGAADRVLHSGDVVQWDYRDWSATPHVPAIVGAFPEPFLHGQNGTLYPTRVECSSDTKSCDKVQQQLDAAGVSAGSGSIGAEARGGVLRIEVGTWKDLSRLQDLDTLAQGPRASGVYALPSPDGSIKLLDTGGHPAQDAPPGTGLIAAVIPADQQPLWVVTGVDEAGVARAAAALTQGALHNAYALALLPSGPKKLPLETP